MSEYYLMHHGILGQKWGKRNGPPYPLSEKDYSSAEKAAQYFKDRPDVTDYKSYKKDIHKNLLKTNSDPNYKYVKKIAKHYNKLSPEQQKQVKDMLPSDMRDNFDDILKGLRNERIIGGITSIAIVAGIIALIWNGPKLVFNAKEKMEYGKLQSRLRKYHKLYNFDGFEVTDKITGAVVDRVGDYTYSRSGRGGQIFNEIYDDYIRQLMNGASITDWGV